MAESAPRALLQSHQPSWPLFKGSGQPCPQPALTPAARSPAYEPHWSHAALSSLRGWACLAWGRPMAPGRAVRRDPVALGCTSRSCSGSAAATGE